jgi:hypothetical protein
MHPNPLLDPLFGEHVVTRQRQLLCAAPQWPRRACGDLACLGTEADSAGLGAEPEPAYTPEKLCTA